MKLYYDDRKQTNILKTQKTIMSRDNNNNNNKFNILMKSIRLVSAIKDDEIENIYAPNEDLTKIKDSSHAICISKNQNNQYNNKNNNNINNANENKPIDSNTSERKLNFK